MMLANIPAVFLGEAVTTIVPLKYVRIAAAIIFAAIGVWVVLAALGLALSEVAGWRPAAAGVDPPFATIGCMLGGMTTIAPLPFASSLPEIAWPAAVTPRGMAVLSFLFQLERTERWPAERLRDLQQLQLKRLLAHAAANVPFHRHRLASLLAAQGEAFWEAWHRMPVLTRAAVQRAGDDLLSSDIPEGHGEVSETFTSGSTGRPVRVLRTELSRFYWSAVTIREHLWHGRDLSGKLAAIRDSTAGKALYPEGLRFDRWGYSTGDIFETA
jgi:hypothetical protein